jgi:hypothetical protein
MYSTVWCCTTPVYYPVCTVLYGVVLLLYITLYVQSVRCCTTPVYYPVCTVLYSVVLLLYTTLYVLFCTVPNFTALNCSVVNIVEYRTVLHCMYCSVVYSTVLYRRIVYSTLLYRRILNETEV